MMHTKLKHLLPNVIGGCEETTTGVIRLKAMEQEGVLQFPMVAVNNAFCKYLFDNRYGTGQSVCVITSYSIHYTKLYECIFFNKPCTELTFLY